MDGLTVKNKEDIVLALISAYELAVKSQKRISIPSDVKTQADLFFSKIEKNMTGFTNIITCLACGATNDSVDVRYHRQPNPSQSESMAEPPKGMMWFSGRGISERIIYPWMEVRKLRTSKSGWQTRTFERPKPYTLEYPENIGYLRDEFLALLNYVSSGVVSSKALLAYLLRLEVRYRTSVESLKENLKKDPDFVPSYSLQNFLNDFFSLEKSSRLPVLCVYSIYQCIYNEYNLYSEYTLLEIGDHEAADSRTGACGDIEISYKDSESIFEAVEVKHAIKYDLSWILRLREKISKNKPKKYLALTTHKDIIAFDSQSEEIYTNILDEFECDFVFENVVTFILSHYRALLNKKLFFSNLEELLKKDKTVTDGHLCFYRDYEF